MTSCNLNHLLKALFPKRHMGGVQHTSLGGKGHRSVHTTWASLWAQRGGSRNKLSAFLQSHPLHLSSSICFLSELSSQLASATLSCRCLFRHPVDSQAQKRPSHSCLRLQTAETRQITVFQHWLIRITLARFSTMGVFKKAAQPHLRTIQSESLEVGPRH